MITRDALKRIEAYKYIAGSYNPLDRYYYKFWWDPALELVPRWMARTVITVIGFVIALGTSALVLMYVSEILPLVYSVDLTRSSSQTMDPSPLYQGYHSPFT